MKNYTLPMDGYRTTTIAELEALRNADAACRPLGGQRVHVGGRATCVTVETIELRDATGAAATVRMLQSRVGPRLARPSEGAAVDVYGRAYGCGGRPVVLVPDAVVGRAEM
jgi:hypothetical protein